MYPTTEILSLQLSYDPNIGPDRQDLVAVIRTGSISGSHIGIADWFEEVMIQERSKMPPHSEPRFAEWEIHTSDRNLFTINETIYDEMYIVIADDEIYWCYYLFANPRIRLTGTCAPSVSVCPCCFYCQYVKLVRTVQDNALQQA